MSALLQMTRLAVRLWGGGKWGCDKEDAYLVILSQIAIITNMHTLRVHYLPATIIARRSFFILSERQRGERERQAEDKGEEQTRSARNESGKSCCGGAG